TEARREGLVAYVYTLLGLDAGLRQAEAVGLRWGSVVWGVGEDDTTRHLRIVESRPRGKGNGEAPKSGRARSEALSRRLRAALLDLYRERWQPSDEELVLEGLRPTGLPGREWRRIRQRSKLGTVRYKDLRSTFASQLFTAGVPLGWVSRALGHSSPVVTAAHYSRYLGEAEDYRDPMTRKAGEVVPDLLSRLPGTGRPQSDPSRGETTTDPSSDVEQIRNVTGVPARTAKAPGAGPKPARGYGIR